MNTQNENNNSHDNSNSTLKKEDERMDAAVTQTSFADFIRANYEKIKSITPVNPTLSKDDEWRKDTSWDNIYEEYNKE